MSTKVKRSEVSEEVMEAPVTPTAVEKYVTVSELKFLKGESIDLVELKKAFDGIAADAERANKGNKAAGRRFRLNTTALSKAFLEIRKVTPRAKMTSKKK